MVFNLLIKLMIIAGGWSRGQVPSQERQGGSAVSVKHTIQIIAGIFPAAAISVYIGKLYGIDPVFSLNLSWLGIPVLSHHFLTVQRLLM